MTTCQPCLRTGVNHVPGLNTVFGHLSDSGVPARAMYITVAMLVLGVVLNFLIPSHAFEYLTSAVTFIGILVWVAILYTHWRFREAQKAAGQELPHWRMPLWPLSSVFAALFLAGIVAILVSAEATRVTVWVGLALLVLISLGYLLTNRRSLAPQPR